MLCACSKEINAKYETYVLNVGDFDERIFLGDDSTMEIGTPAKGSLAAAYESSERLQITRNLLQNYHDVSRLGMFSGSLALLTKVLRASSLLIGCVGDSVLCCFSPYSCSETTS